MIVIIGEIIKLIIIFTGSGLACLLALWIIDQTKSIAQLILNPEGRKIKKTEFILVQKKQVSGNIGFYEAQLPSGDLIKLFSSDSGMKLI